MNAKRPRSVVSERDDGPVVCPRDLPRPEAACGCCDPAVGQPRFLLGVLRQLFLLLCSRARYGGVETSTARNSGQAWPDNHAMPWECVRRLQRTATHDAGED